jgi:tetratricopeptide (TPR) repeat protein
MRWRRYGELSRLLDDELGLEPSTPVRELHEQILAGDSTLALPATTSAGIRTVPRMLPAAIGDFSGRKAQLARLDDLLPLDTSERPEAVVISAISGTAGIGKTMLAVHWAHRVADRFPDGQLYVNLRGFHPTGRPVTPAEALRGFLDALGVPAERVPADLDARIGLYRSLLADRQVLVLLDNPPLPPTTTPPSEQAWPLLPGAPGCLVVVASRNRLTGLVGAEAARPLLLDLLTAEESRELLTRRLGADRTDAEPRAVQAIIRSCARLPLALAIAAARAATNPTFPLRVLADELAEAGGGLDAFAGADPAADVRAVFSWSYRQLGDPAARLFRLLGRHPGPDISGPAAASLAGVPPGEARSLLAELTRAHLLTQHQPGRYTFHDLLRAYATELVRDQDSAADREEATRRLLDHYVHTASVSAALLHPHRDPVSVGAPRPGVTAEVLDDYKRAVDWYEAERPVLHEVIRMAVDSGLEDPAWQLAWMFGSQLSRSGRWEEQAATYRAGLEAVRRLDDLAGQSRMHRGLAAAARSLGRYDEAHEHFQQALDIAGTVGDVAGQARVHHGLSAVCQLDGRLPEALKHAQRALGLFRELGSRAGVANLLGEVGWSHVLLGQYEEAIASCEEALVLMTELDDKPGLGPLWDTIGYARHHLGEHADALACFEQALSFRRELGERRDQAETLEHLGDTYHAMGDDQAARRHWQEALDILDELGVRDSEALRAKLDAGPGSGSAAGAERQHVR